MKNWLFKLRKYKRKSLQPTERQWTRTFFFNLKQMVKFYSAIFPIPLGLPADIHLCVSPVSPLLLPGWAVVWCVPGLSAGLHRCLFLPEQTDGKGERESYRRSVVPSWDAAQSGNRDLLTDLFSSSLFYTSTFYLTNHCLSVQYSVDDVVSVSAHIGDCRSADQTFTVFSSPPGTDWYNSFTPG